MNEIQFIDAFYRIDEYFLYLYYYKNNILIMFLGHPVKILTTTYFAYFSGSIITVLIPPPSFRFTPSNPLWATRARRHATPFCPSSSNHMI